MGQLLEQALERAGFCTVLVASAEAALARLASLMPALVLLDWMLPGLSGPQLVRRLRRDARLQVIPIIMLTARTQEDDKVQGLEAGVDDYMTKPFSPRELIARVQALLRRVQPPANDTILRTGALTLNAATHMVTAHGFPIKLSPIEFRLLHCLMAYPKRVYTRAQLLDHVWAPDCALEERTVDVHILRLRKVLAAHGLAAMIQTVRGVGYGFTTT